MDNRTFNMYCDESTHLINDHHPYMLLGYVSIAYPLIEMAKKQIKAIKSRYNFTDELKWVNVHNATQSMYSELVDYFFTSDLQFRSVIVDKSQINETRQDYSFNDFYFRMYYQLLHHLTDLESNYNVYLDIKDTCSHHTLHKLKGILKWNTAIRHFQFIRSHESCFIQMADVLMGAINYNLRIEREDIQGKVIAKRVIVDKIKEHTNISLSKSTYLSNRKFNLFFISLK